MGHVGSDLAYTLCRENTVDTLVLIDKDDDKVYAETLELEDAMASTSSQVAIIQQDYQALSDAALIVLAVGSTDLEKEDRISELTQNAQSAKEVVPKAVASGFSGIFLVISNPCDVMTMLVQQYSGFPKHKVMGTGTTLDTNRLKRIVGKIAGVSSQSVEGFVLGEHGESQFVAWSTVRIAGEQLSELPAFAAQDLPVLKEQVRLGGWEIFTRKTWTSYGIASVASRLIQTILKDERRIFPVSAYDESKQIYAGYPHIIGRQGVIEALPLTLTQDEINEYELSAEKIRRTFLTVT